MQLAVPQLQNLQSGLYGPNEAFLIESALSGNVDNWSSEMVLKIMPLLPDTVGPAHIFTSLVQPLLASQTLPLRVKQALKDGIESSLDENADADDSDYADDVDADDSDYTDDVDDSEDADTVSINWEDEDEVRSIINDNLGISQLTSVLKKICTNKAYATPTTAEVMRQEVIAPIWPTKPTVLKPRHEKSIEDVLNDLKEMLSARSF
jgi:hypothetical protein